MRTYEQDLRFGTDLFRNDVGAYAAMLLTSGTVAGKIRSAQYTALRERDKDFIRAVDAGTLPDPTQLEDDQADDYKKEKILAVSKDLELTKPEGVAAIRHLYGPQEDLHPASRRIFTRYVELSEEISDFVLDQCRPLMVPKPFSGNVLEFTAVMNGVRNEFATWFSTLIFEETGMQSYAAPTETADLL